MDFDVAVIGAGAAGLLAATCAAERGRRTLLLEKNRRPGAKILISGGTRCNLTHAAQPRDIVAAFGPTGRFLHSALAALGPEDLRELFAAEGVPTKIEPGGKVFPASDRASDLLAALLRRLQRTQCTLALEEPLQQLERADEGFHLTTARRTLSAGKVVLTTGGQSYPGCGTTGDGYRFAAELGHTVVAARPALVPVTVNAPWVQALQGVTVPEVAVRLIDPAAPSKKACLAECRGSFLFTHFGLSGPAVLDISRYITGHARPETLVLQCDFLPDLTEAVLDERLRQEAAVAGKRQLASILPHELPRRLGEAVLEQAGVPAETKAAELSKAQRGRLVEAIKRSAIPVTGTRGFDKAEVTAGGVRLDEVDSRTLQSKLVPGLYFAGEVLDLDGPIGGYNFQAAFSTGWLAGQSA
ncbi:MAG: BaiN/RdsA family NAD(P)/FAD-dependent oxidoreductase [Pirellulales bacterium]